MSSRSVDRFRGPVRDLARTEAGHLLTVGCWRNGTIDDLKAEVMRRAPQCWPEYREVRRLLRLRLAGGTLSVPRLLLMRR